MRILYLHQYFRTPAQGGALRSYYIGQALLQAGHQVTLITAHNEHDYQVRDVDGITVYYLPVSYQNRYSPLRRVLAFVHFMWQSYRVAAKQKNTDLVYTTSTPLSVGIVALLLKKFYRRPYVFEVRDLWPEAPVQLGYIRNNWLIKGLRRLEKKIYSEAEHIVALSPGMAAGVTESVPGKAITVLPNMADCEFYQPTQKPQTYRRIEVTNQLVISYFGALGKANRVSFLLNLAETCLLAGFAEATFFIAGTGAEEQMLKQQAGQKQLRNVHFLGELNREEVRELLAASDCTYTSFDTQPILQTNSPNKFFDSLAAGKVCLVNTKGWLKELVEIYRFGYYCDPENPVDTVRQLQLIHANPELLRELQQNSRQLAERQFSREKICAGVVQVVEQTSRNLR